MWGSSDGWRFRLDTQVSVQCDAATQSETTDDGACEPEQMMIHFSIGELSFVPHSLLKGMWFGFSSKE